MPLSNKRKVFISEYLRDFNATQAAIRAGYSPRSASVTSTRLIANASISAEIKRQIDAKIMTADEVLTRLADMARGDISDLMSLSTMGFTFELMVRDENGDLIPNPKTKLIKKIKQRVTTYLGKKDDSEDREIVETELELYDAQSALALIGKYHSLFVDRQEITGKDGEPIDIKLIEVMVPDAGDDDPTE